MIFTIGTSNRSLPEFIHELQRRNITHLVDVRSNPYSRYAWFNAPRLADWAERSGLLYRHEGKALGGRELLPSDDPRFVGGVKRIIEIAGRETLAIFCSEGDPENCHRAWAIGAALVLDFGVTVINVRRDGTEEDMRSTFRRISPAMLEPRLRQILMQKSQKR